MLVVGDDQQGLRPPRAAAQRLVHVVDELLAQGDVVVRVLAVPARPPARLQKRERRQRARRRGRGEVGEVPEVARGRRGDVGEVALGQRFRVVPVNGPAELM